MSVETFVAATLMQQAKKLDGLRHQLMQPVATHSARLDVAIKLAEVQGALVRGCGRVVFVGRP